jgi:hypothetical protein
MIQQSAERVLVPQVSSQLTATIASAKETPSKIPHLQSVTVHQVSQLKFPLAISGCFAGLRESLQIKFISHH